jgi:hypothetical protein
MSRAVTRILPLLLLVLPACVDAPTVVAPDGARRAESQPAPASIRVVMSNLESPRGLAWGPDGALYVVESGEPVATGPCAPVVRGLNCYSGTGAISRLRDGVQERVLSGLPSVYIAELNDIAGPHHLSFDERGAASLTIGWGGEPVARAALGELGQLFGTLLTVEPDGQWRVADVAAYEQANNPDGRLPDSNPYGVLAERNRKYVIDAGGNTLLEVRSNGQVSLVAVFPTTPVPPGPFNPPFAVFEAVPTQVRRGPGGALYVSILTGAPFLPGAAGIYRIRPNQPPQLFAGFTQITDFTFAPDGSGYLVQHGSGPFFSGPGALVHVAPDGTRTTITTELVRPVGVAVGPDEAVYVSHKPGVPGGGEVLRIVP